MNDCFVLIVEESIKSFSVVGSGVDFKYTFAVKGQTKPFEDLKAGDHVIGYISNGIKEFCYLFDVDSVTSNNECILKKTFETVNGLQFDLAPSDVKNAIHDNEQTTSFIKVDPNSYSKMVRLMLGTCNKAECNKLDGVTKKIIDEKTRRLGGSNTLLYGVPGSGKSWTIEHEYCHESSKVERLVFHPDYSNADFIGQILPVVDLDKQVTYEFTPGPFTSIVHDAYEDPMTEFVLIIEEINRGNAPAIFGEVFQLLDRKVEKVDGDDGYPTGTSEYGITHKYMAEYIYGDPRHKVRIPSNLSIIGTMNTSDQNVFTLDTAFQRRWRMRLIENNFDNVRTSLADAEILDTKVSWKRFCENINGLIVGNKSKMASAEDKRLGVYFIHENDVRFDERAIPSEGYDGIYAELKALEKLERSETIDSTQKARLSDIREALMQNRIFPEKVIKYLWDDAFKFSPELLFDTDNYNCLEDIIAIFTYSSGNDRFAIFKPAMRGNFYPSAGSSQEAQ